MTPATPPVAVRVIASKLAPALIFIMVEVASTVIFWLAKRVILAAFAQVKSSVITVRLCPLKVVSLELTTTSDPPPPKVIV